MRVLIAAALCVLSVSAQAKPSRHPPVTQFSGDRYVKVAQPGTSARDIVGPSARCPPLCKPRRAGKAKYLYRTKPRQKTAPVPRPRPGTVAPLTMAGGAWREVRTAASTVIGGRPAGCPHRFCGCALSIKLFGRIVPHLNLAANWLRFPRVAPAPGMVAARRGHVFKLLAHIGGNRWQVWDANSGRGRIRVHPRSIAGYAIVNPRAG